MRKKTNSNSGTPRQSIPPKPYVLEDQVGFILRQVTQRHTLTFMERINDNLTPTQFSALVKVNSDGPISQNLLGRLTAMDTATVKGVVDRLVARGYVESRLDAKDSRLRLLNLTAPGRRAVERALSVADSITDETLRPLKARQRKVLIELLRLIC